MFHDHSSSVLLLTRTPRGVIVGFIADMMIRAQFGLRQVLHTLDQFREHVHQTVLAAAGR